MARSSHIRVAGRFRLRTARGTVILPAGSKLFHGTIEPFSTALRPGGYDAVAWFADDPTIAQLYIPRAGASTIVSSTHIAQPSQDSTIQAIQKMVGLHYSKVEWDSGGRVRSYQTPDVPPWNRIGGVARSRVLRALIDAENEVKAFSQRRLEISQARKRGEIDADERIALTTETFNEQGKVEARIKELEVEYNALNNGYEKEIEKRLEAMGYEPYLKGRPGDQSYRFYLEGRRVLPPGGSADGRLFIGTTTRDMTLWLKARGEGDLMNVQYHDVRGFRDARDEGLDGVMIDDFAQSEAHGNLGHLSVGLFSPALKDVRFKQVPATYEEYDRSGKTKAYPRGGNVDFHRLF